LDRRLRRPQSHSGCGGEKKNSQPPPGIKPKNSDHTAHSIVFGAFAFVAVGEFSH